MILGIDFDNTIINYDHIFYQEALKRGYIKLKAVKNKKMVRDYIRKLPDGENKWQQLQVHVYGKAISQAKLIDGAKSFIKACREKNIKVYIVSHKTKYEFLGRQKVDLRRAALNWMKENDFFSKEGLALKRNQIFFETTRQEKVNRIKALRCTHFIDDLQETFLEKSFPEKVERILYSPTREAVTLRDVWVSRSWGQIHESIFSGGLGQIKLTASKMLNENVEEVHRLFGGLNNRVYSLKVQGKVQYALKYHFGDDLKRKKHLTQEYNGLSFLYRHGVRQIPQPVVLSEENSCAIYEYIDGEKISSIDVKETDIRQAVDFLKALKKIGNNNDSSALSNASEACFSIQDTEENIQQRLNRFKNLKDRSAVYQQMQEFLKKDFLPFLKELNVWRKKKSEEYGLSLTEKIKKKERTLSPSDFGFHNALRCGDEIVFLDFEHFGWDDPAKMVADFLLHPAMNLSEENKKFFVGRISDVFSDNEKLGKRVEVVYPYFGLKWCLIFLNEFVKSDLQRREFAGDSLDKNEILQAQLKKAKNMLGVVRKNYRNFFYGN